MDEVQRLILKIEGVERLEQLNAELAKEEQYLKNLLLIQKQGVVVVNPADIQRSANAIIAMNKELEKLRGQTGVQGYGILGASYAFQDFVSVLQGGQGIERALMSITNNFTQMATAAGASVAMAAKLSFAFTGFTALIPIVKSLWDAFGDTEKVDENVKKIEDRIKQAVEAMARLKGEPTEAERAAAAGVKGFLGQRPTAALAEAAIMAATTPGQAVGGLAAADQLRYRQLGAAAGMTDEQIERDMRARALMGESPQEQALARADLQRQRQEAINQRQEMLLQGRRQRAAAVIEEAQVAGPKGEEARGVLFGATAGRPGFVGLQEFTPEEMEAKAERRRRTEIQNKRAEAMANLEAKNYAEKIAKNKELTAQGEAEQHRGEDEQRAAAEQDKRDEQRWNEEMIPKVGAGREQRRRGQLRQARGAVTQVSEAQGLGTPSPEQADEMASNMLRGMEGGLNAQAAAWQAVQQKWEAMVRMTQQFQASQNRLMMGPDQNGQFSQIPPMMP